MLDVAGLKVGTIWPVVGLSSISPDSAVHQLFLENVSLVVSGGSSLLSADSPETLFEGIRQSNALCCAAAFSGALES